MACAVPVVATDVGAFSEIVNDSAAGTIVAPGDITALTQATANILENRGRLADAEIAARKHVEAHFSLQREAEALVSVYRALLSPKK